MFKAYNVHIFKYVLHVFLYFYILLKNITDKSWFLFVIQKFPFLNNSLLSINEFIH